MSVRWTPAFAGVTGEEWFSSFVIPAKAGIHAFKAEKRHLNGKMP
jgi:hypothetical protein